MHFTSIISKPKCWNVPKIFTIGMLDVGYSAHSAVNADLLL